MMGTFLLMQMNQKKKGAAYLPTRHCAQAGGPE
jgi:hypothetical protein